MNQRFSRKRKGPQEVQSHESRSKQQSSSSQFEGATGGMARWRCGQIEDGNGSKCDGSHFTKNWQVSTIIFYKELRCRTFIHPVLDRTNKHTLSAHTNTHY